MRSDRHGRATRADNDRRRRPHDGFRVRDAARFATVVEDAIATLPPRLADPLDDADVLVDDVPPPAATHPDGSVVLAVFRPPRLTVYRRPLEGRAESRGDLEEVVRLAVGEAVAFALGLHDDLDDLYDDEE